jgi:hypothetical protein
MMVWLLRQSAGAKRTLAKQNGYQAVAWKPEKKYHLTT